MNRKLSWHNPSRIISALAILLATLTAASGAGTNAITAFTVNKAHFYVQSNSGPSVASGVFPYVFTAGLLLISNRAANSVTVTLPGGSVRTLTSTANNANNYLFVGFAPSASALDTSYRA